MCIRNGDISRWCIQTDNDPVSRQWEAHKKAPSTRTPPYYGGQISWSMSKLPKSSKLYKDPLAGKVCISTCIRSEVYLNCTFLYNCELMVAVLEAMDLGLRSRCEGMTGIRRQVIGNCRFPNFILVQLRWTYVRDMDDVLVAYSINSHERLTGFFQYCTHFPLNLKVTLKLYDYMCAVSPPLICPLWRFFAPVCIWYALPSIMIQIPYSRYEANSRQLYQ